MGRMPESRKVPLGPPISSPVRSFTRAAMRLRLRTLRPNTMRAKAFIPEGSTEPIATVFISTLHVSAGGQTFCVFVDEHSRLDNTTPVRQRRATDLAFPGARPFLFLEGSGFRCLLRSMTNGPIRYYGRGRLHLAPPFSPH